MNGTSSAETQPLPTISSPVTREEFEHLCQKVDLVLQRLDAIYDVISPRKNHRVVQYEDSANQMTETEPEIAQAQFSNHTYPVHRKKKHKRPREIQNADGQVSIPLGKVDLCQLVEETASIEAPKKDALGEICFSLRYVPQKSQLTVVILECKNLKKMDIGGLSDPYVKIAIMQGGKRIKKSKTTIKMHTLNPYYNESFKFDVAPQVMGKIQLWLTVVDYDRVGSNDVIGRVILGQGVGGNPQKHWMEVLEKPRRSIAQWHNLTTIEEKK